MERKKGEKADVGTSSTALIIVVTGRFMTDISDAVNFDWNHLDRLLL